ncbi:hypothetical protein T484DRAFT_1888497, partial [Baffinella frigidus]
MLSNVEALSHRVAQGSVEDGADGRTSVGLKWPYAEDCVVALAQGVVDVCWEVVNASSMSHPCPPGEVQRESTGALVHAAKHQELRAKVVTVCERYAPGSFPTPDGLLSFLSSLADGSASLAPPNLRMAPTTAARTVPTTEAGLLDTSPGGRGWDVGAFSEAGTVQDSRAALSRTVDQYNARAPAMGGSLSSEEYYTLRRSAIEKPGAAFLADRVEAARVWAPQRGSVTRTGIREGDVILVGPLKRLCRVREAVPLDGGVEIYATDRYGGRVYIPANSPLAEHAWTPAAAADRSLTRGKIDGGTRTLPVVSATSSRHLPRGHKYAPLAGFTSHILVDALERGRTSRHTPGGSHRKDLHACGKGGGG